MTYDIAPFSFDDFVALRQDPNNNLSWSHVFTLPIWLKTWWSEFGAGLEEHIQAVKENENVIGIAPLMVKDGSACFIGSADVCDYMDFIVSPGQEEPFFTVLLDSLRRDRIQEIFLESLRADSAALTHFVELAKNQGYNAVYSLDEVSLDLDLPSSWEGFLEILTPKQRREVNRKQRRLHEAGDIQYETIDDKENIRNAMSIFLRLLRESRKDKADFMTTRMESFFRSIADRMAEAGLLRLGILRINGQPVASTMSFDYNNNIYLYNSGYDPLYSYLSVGLLSKVMSVKDSIERGRNTYDFLKGAEEYKYRLGGREIPIYSCRIGLT
jgi:CelD/BcsL family acetyltransferase involved in cellulose biosynthesis